MKPMKRMKLKPPNQDVEDSIRDQDEWKGKLEKNGWEIFKISSNKQNMGKKELSKLNNF